LTTTGDLSACKSKRTLIRQSIVNTLPTWSLLHLSPAMGSWEVLPWRPPRSGHDNFGCAVARTGATLFSCVCRPSGVPSGNITSTTAPWAVARKTFRLVTPSRRAGDGGPAPSRRAGEGGALMTIEGLLPFGT
jgi:hypothetical protein